MRKQIKITYELLNYLRYASLREPAVLKELRQETMKLSDSVMQIPPEQGQFFSLLMKIISPLRTLDIGTYTGYSSLCVALSTPKNCLTVTCDINRETTEIAQKYWEKANVTSKIKLMICEANLVLDQLINEYKYHSFDFIFIDADKNNYENYYEKSILLLKKGGLIAIDNTFLFGAVANKNEQVNQNANFTKEMIQTVNKLNIKIKYDKRVDISMLPVSDGLLLIRKR